MSRYTLCVLLVLFYFSCEEIPPVITPSQASSCSVLDAADVADQQRQVLIEEFTGVRCSFCPGGARAIEELLTIHEKQLVVVSYHAGFFSTPFQESSVDFRTDAAEQILSLIGAPLGYPTAAVDRKMFAGQDDLQLPRSDWSAAIEQQLTEAPEVKLALRAEVTADNLLTIQAGVFPQDNLYSEDDDMRISILLTESDITDVQQTTTGKETDYVHHHVFRTFLTAHEGDRITDRLIEGEPFCLSFDVTPDVEWNMDELTAIAFIHRSGNLLNVLQAAELKVVP